MNLIIKIKYKFVPIIFILKQVQCENDMLNMIRCFNNLTFIYHEFINYMIASKLFNVTLGNY